ncbi:MAG TPA: sugar ABC transporter permease [Spirochaetales bacterium]|nr:sugar ABC transporter permease [Spirochaetales bacterium]
MNGNKAAKPGAPGRWIARVAPALAAPILALAALWAGFALIKEGWISGGFAPAFAAVWGVAGAALLFFVANWSVERLGPKVRARALPFVFVGPAILVMAWYLAAPTVRTLALSFFDASSRGFAGLDNYAYVFSDRTMRIAFINNLAWLVFGTGFSVLSGLVIAIMADRSRFERVAKSLVFLPMAISFVGAGVIWRFVYAYRPEGDAQVGLLNALVTAAGGAPVNWIVERPWNTLFLIVIFVWLQTGFAMVVLSAAIKGVPGELLEAARIDGASELRVVRSVLIPSILPSIVTVATTTLLLTLKVFDIVYAMTNGLYGTEVLASQQYKQMFKFLHYGRGSAIAIVILVAVTPMIWYNLRQFNKREAFS